jgi:NitT/TauT family transport system ATP-binding protein
MVFEECIEGEIKDYKRKESLMSVKDVSKSFTTNNGGVNRVLEGLSFDIKDIHGKPQIAALLGQSGSGKTTALRIVAGLDAPDSGEVTLCHETEVDDKPTFCPVRAGEVGVVFQKYPLFDNMTVLDNLVEPAVKTGTGRDEAFEKAKLYLSAFNLDSSTGNYPVQLSGGQRQRVAILQQLMIDNRHFIVLDEPFSGLDVSNLQSVIKLITSVANMHTLNTFIIVTHDVTNALIVADTIYVLGRAEKDEKGKPSGPAHIVKEYDLVSEGLAYRPNIEDIPRFTELRKELKYNIIPNV